MSRVGPRRLQRIDDELAERGFARPAVAAKELGVDPALLGEHRLAIDSTVLWIDEVRVRAIPLAEVERLREAMKA